MATSHELNVTCQMAVDGRSIEEVTDVMHYLSNKELSERKRMGGLLAQNVYSTSSSSSSLL